MPRLLTGTRFLIVVPIIGLAAAASVIFIFGGYGLHKLLVGTVLYITAVGHYQLFIQEIKFPGGLKIDSPEELETKLIGVTVVVLAVNSIGAVFVRGTKNLLQYGAGIVLPIAALFVGLRAWSVKLNDEARGEFRSMELKPSLGASRIVSKPN